MEAVDTRTRQDLPRKIFLDDVRDVPNDTWLLARTATEFFGLLKKHQDSVEVVSLDHDLGEHQGGYMQPAFDGAWVARWMVNEDVLPSKMIYIHSMNPVGAANMVNILNEQNKVPVKRVSYEDLR